MPTAIDYQYRNGVAIEWMDDLWLFKSTKATASDIICYGDFVDYSSGEFTLTVAADNTIFAGVCIEDSPGAEQHPDQKITVSARCRVRIPLASGQAAIAIGRGLAWSTGPSVVNKNAGTVVAFTLALTAVEAVCWAAESVAANATSILAIVDVPLLKAFGSNAIANTTIETATT